VKLVTVIQARVGSSRLPGKVLLPLAGKELLVRLLERVNRATLSGTVVVATTCQPEDDAIVQLCQREKVPFFRGHETDLLDRHFQAATRYEAEAVVKIPSDCPLIDPHIIDRVIFSYLAAWRSDTPYDYVSNLHPGSYPDGNDVEIMSMEVLKTASQEASKDFEREHTTPFIWEHPYRFRLGNVCWETGRDYSMSHRFTIDYPEDYRFIKAVYDRLYHGNSFFALEEILELLEAEREVFEINRKYAGVNWYRHHLDQLHTVDKTHTRPDPGGSKENSGVLKWQ
jgi:spore coat polysaccharide biosynthesis protein SpsF